MAILRIVALAKGRISQRDKAIRDWVDSYRIRVKREYPNAEFNTEFVLGCTIPEFVAYAETLMAPGMTWENKHEKWQFKVVTARDRLAPPAEEFYRYYNYTNLKPVWKVRKAKGFIADPTKTSPLDRDGDQV